jgi:hypothetical protein
MELLLLWNHCLFFIYVRLIIVKLVQRYRIVFYVFSHIFCNWLLVYQVVMQDFINMVDIVFCNVLQILFLFNRPINVKLVKVLALPVLQKLAVILVLMDFFYKEIPV